MEAGDQEEVLEPENPDSYEDPVIVQFVPRKLPQVLCALAAAIGTFCLGTVLAWSAPSIPSIVAGGQLGVLSDHEKSLIGSLVPLGAAVSAFVVTFLMNKIGRRLSMISIGIPFVAGWVLIASAHCLPLVLVGRFVTGFCGGAYIFVAPVYISETVQDHIRGLLCTIAGVSLTVGILFVYILGAIKSWVFLSWVCSVPPAILMVCMIFAPESPRYLLQKGKLRASALALRTLRGATRILQIEPELKKIQKSIQLNDAKPASFKDFFEMSVLKPLLITAMLMFLQQAGGVSAIQYYLVDIFKSASTDIDANLASIIVATVQVVCVAVSAVLVERTGRKILFIISEIGMTISLVGLGIFFTLKGQNNGETPDNLGWLPLGCLVFYIITYNIALGPLPWVMMGELLPPHVKGVTVALCSSFCWGLAFIVAFTFADLLTLLGPEGCYFLFGGCCATGVLFAIFVIPETKGKSLDEIQALFQ